MTLEEFNKALEQGAYAWPGGYPLYFLMSDGEAISFEAARQEAARIRTEIESQTDEDWIPLACEVNWEDSQLFCAHTGTRIESAYAEED
ncbi:MAG: hypothetical protein EBT13_08595 [Rhodobacteraceae bacterium]|jgi:hypothetical protein|nr:hypothetical protein [Paracoccaceae bacterium]